MLALAKPALDIGLATNQWDAMRAFYVDQLGLPYEELLPIGGGVRQHRLGLRGGVLKINDHRNPLGDEPTGYRRLLIADPDVTEPVSATDPDGLEVTRVPPGHDGVEAMGFVVAVADLDKQERFVSEALGATPIAKHTYKLATTTIVVEHDPAAERAGSTNAVGFRYTTIQVRDVVADHQRLIDLGVEQAMPPRKLGEVAMISMIRDPAGNWIEISQRASLTGPLPS